MNSMRQYLLATGLLLLTAGAQANRGSVLLWMEQPEEAAECFDRAARATDDLRVLRYVAGELLRAADIALEAEAERRYEDRSFELLERAVAGGYRDFDDLRSDPKLQRLRSRPEFEELLGGG